MSYCIYFWMFPMVKSSNLEESSSSLNSNSTISIRSSYFHTDVNSGKSNYSTIDDCDSRVSGSKMTSIRHENCTWREIQGSSHNKKVSKSVQADRSIIGGEDSLPKERKRWIRPPVVGQASSSNGKSLVLPVSQSFVSSESDDEIKAQISNRNEPASYLGTSENLRTKIDYNKSIECGSDHSLPPFPESHEFQRIPTPSSVSSITPRPLEWDSGADVGYFQQYSSNNHHLPEFSAVERMAVEKGRTDILVRSDPEGKTCSKKGNSTVLNMIGVPTFESTPINTSEAEKKSSFKKPNAKKNGSSMKYQHLFPEVIVQNKGNQSDSNSDYNYSFKNSKSEEIPSSSLPKKLSTSLENVNDSKCFEHQSATYPRSQSQLNLTAGNNGINTLTLHLQKENKPQSVSSSSTIATVVTSSPKKATKCIQTSNIENSIGIQSSIGQRESSERHPIYKNVEHQDSSTLESIQMSTGDRVNSFEYLPGHVYENSKNPNNLDIWDDVEGVSLRNDVERGVHILEQFIQGSNANNTLMKKKLIQKVVKRLIYTDYPEDSESVNNVPQRCSTRRSQNRDEISGESNSEKTKANQPPKDNSTSLSGQSSSTWQSVTASTKSSGSSNINSFVPEAILKKNTEDGTNKATIEGLPESKKNWKSPVTRAEKNYEHKKKGIYKDVYSDDQHQLLEFLNSERENQLGWIVKEINHLSNLKVLLEKHERLKKNLNRLKKAKQKNERVLENDVRSTNLTRTFRRRPFHNMETFKRPSGVNTKDNHKTDSDNSWDSHNYEADEQGKLKKSVSTETGKEIIKGIKSTAYTITFDPSPKDKKGERNEIENEIIADRQTLAKKSREFVRETYQLPSLQDLLISKRPDIVSRAELRRKTVSELAAIRQLREEQRPVVLAAALSYDTGLGIRPPPPLVRRVVSQKEMRQQTEKKYRQTFEVKQKISDQKLKESLKTNRLMANIYNKRLQLLTLKGHTNLSNSLDVISTV